MNYASENSPSPDDDKLLHRVRSLLAKAESTTFADEAAALTAKAHELMAIHTIDQAMLEADRGGAVVTSQRVVLQRPYVKQKYTLLCAVADPNRCRAILGVNSDDLDLETFTTYEHGTKIATVFGHDCDLAAVETLFTSLLLQAVNIMLHQGSMVDEWGENRTRSFRSSFLQGFAWTIHDRLAEVQQTVDLTADERSGGRLLPVLVDRRGKVDDAVAEAFPRLGTLRTSITNAHGVAAGRHAARHADLGQSRVAGNQRQLRS